MVKTARPVLGARSVSSIRQSDIEKFYLTLKKQGAAAGSIERYRNSISAFFTWTIKDGERTR